MNLREAICVVLAMLVAAGVVYWALAWRAARRHFKPQAPVAEASRFAPFVSILKPVKGVDAEALANFTTFCRQRYGGGFEILFAAADPADPVFELIRALQQSHPAIAISALVAEPLGANPKTASLDLLARSARGEVLVISDGDIRVGEDYLAEVVQPLADPSVGLVTCAYRGIEPRTLAARLEALHMQTVFLPAVALALAMGHRIGLGATLALRRGDLQRAGGFRAIADHLMDDNQLAALIEGLGLRTVLSRYVVCSVLGKTSFAEQWGREVRWMRGIRVTAAGKYFAMAITFPTPWALLLAIASGGAAWGIVALAAVVAMRCLATADVQRRSGGGSDAALAPLRDLLGLMTWIAGAGGARVTWRGQTFILQRDGRLCPPDAAEAISV